MSRILVVEDEIHIQRLIKLILEKNQFLVDTVSSGEAALEHLQSRPSTQLILPDMILLDVLMPGIDGLSVLRACKASTELKNIPIILLTALAQESIVMQGVSLGAADYIRKPFHPVDLVRRLHKHLGEIAA